MTGKQRASLRAMANPLDTIIYIGKEGITDGTVKEVYDALEAADREGSVDRTVRKDWSRTDPVHRTPVRDVPAQP